MHFEKDPKVSLDLRYFIIQDFQIVFVICNNSVSSIVLI